MSLKFNCPKCGTVWQVGPNITEMIRNLRRQKLDLSKISMIGERKCNGCGRTMTIKEVVADAYDS